MGDITGDGIDDIVFAFQRDLNPSDDKFLVAVRDGTTGALIPGREHEQPNYTPSNNGSPSWGNSICIIGDLNGDGSAEYAIADKRQNLVRVFMGNGALNLYDHVACEIGASNQGGADRWFGQSMAAAGDMNGDGVPDLLVSDGRIKYGSTGSESIGAVYIMSGALLIADWAEEEKEILNGAPYPTDPLAFPTLTADDHIGRLIQNRSQTGINYFGHKVAGGLDANGDGTPDILVTSKWINWDGQSSTVQKSGVLLFSGLRFTRPIHTYKFPEARYCTPSTDPDCPHVFNNFGNSIDFVHNVEDVMQVTLADGTVVSTGYHDVLIGDPGAPFSASPFEPQGDEGFAFGFSSTPDNFDLLEVQQGEVVAFGLYNKDSGTRMGSRVRRAGKVNPSELDKGCYWVSESRWRKPGDTANEYQGRGRVLLVGGNTSNGLLPNSASYLYFDEGSQEQSNHGTRLASSGTTRVWDPNLLLPANFGFSCVSSPGTAPGPLPGSTSAVFRP